MSNKPSNWYQMDYDQQREWEQNQRAIEDAEYEMRQAQEHADELIRDAKREIHRQQEQAWEDNRQLSDELDTVSKQNKMLRDALQEMIFLFNKVDEKDSKFAHIVKTIKYAQEALKYDGIAEE